jgi:hypothetical protein
MRPKIKGNFTLFWDGFSLATFEEMFPSVWQRYNLELASEPDVVFYSAYSPKKPLKTPDGRYIWCMPVLPPGNFLRVFMSGENIEPVMANCEFAIDLYW